MKRLSGITVFSLVLFIGCATYTLKKEDLKSQLIKGDAYHKTYIPILYSEFKNNNIKKILCINSDGEKVFLFPNINTQLVITTKSGKVFKAYFNTVFINGDKITGLRSRFVGGKDEVLFDDIKTIEIYAENAKTIKYNESVKH